MAKDPIAEATLVALDGKSAVSRLAGYFRGMNGNRAWVDFGGGRVPADMGMSVLPEVNDPVWIQLVDNRDPLVVGFTIPRPAGGKVTQITGDVALVDTALLGVIEADMLALVNVGDDVILHWNGGPTVLGTLVSARTTPDAPGAPGGGTRDYAPEFSALQSGSWRDGRYWTSQVRAGDTNQGVWTHGTKIADTVPASALIKSVELFISPVSVGGSAPIFGLHGLTALSGGPAFGPQAAIAVPRSGGWMPLPTNWGDLLKAGGGYRGVGINHGGNSIFNPAGVGQSGAIRIRYSA